MRGYRKKGEEERIEGKMKERRKGEREEKKNQGQPGAVSLVPYGPTHSFRY